MATRPAQAQAMSYGRSYRRSFSGASNDVATLGQTWSEARVATLKGYSHPVLIMGAGYDNVAEDASPAGATTIGNAVFMIDALDGTLLKTLATTKSVAAPVAVIDTDYDGY